MYNLQWSRKELSSNKLGTFGEYYAKMSLASYGMSIYTSEVDDHGIDFVAETGHGFLKFQVKTIRQGTGYVYMAKKYFDITDKNLYLLLITLTDGEHPALYVLPSALWESIFEDNKLFVYHSTYEEPEYGINLSKKNLPLIEKFRLEKMIDELL